uniref:Uncharacterized protein n=1 Tax=Romanomermis culicivorax TaxID=13658 RepID=A0A915IR91_ROMCU
MLHRLLKLLRAPNQIYPTYCNLTARIFVYKQNRWYCHMPTNFAQRHILFVKSASRMPKKIPNHEPQDPQTDRCFLNLTGLRKAPKLLKS